MRVYCEAISLSRVCRAVRICKTHRGILRVRRCRASLLEVCNSARSRPFHLMSSGATAIVSFGLAVALREVDAEFCNSSTVYLYGQPLSALEQVKTLVNNRTRLVARRLCVRIFGIDRLLQVFQRSCRIAQQCVSAIRERVAWAARAKLSGYRNRWLSAVGDSYRHVRNLRHLSSIRIAVVWEQDCFTKLPVDGAADDSNYATLANIA